MTLATLVPEAGSQQGSASTFVPATALPAGPPGPLGATGPRGLQGIAGPQGASGTGATGATGSGATGVAGPQGATGLQGIQGATGTTGGAGPQGATGSSGPIGATGPQGKVLDISIFSTPGSFTGGSGWVKPANAALVEVWVVGAGGGGGAGRRGPTTENSGGGGGGAGGGLTWARFRASNLPATVDIVVGGGGSGGAAQAADATNGAGGSTGGNSYFGALAASDYFLTGLGGVGGAGGSTAVTSTAAGGAGRTSGGPGGAGNNVNDGAAANPPSAIAPTGGGGGGGLVATTRTLRNGGAGGGYGALSGFAAPGHTNTSAAGGVASTLTAAQAGTGSGYENVVGQGGGGGYCTNANVGGAGGNGAQGGGGGGGGGSSTNGLASGAGGNGGDGTVLVICYDDPGGSIGATGVAGPPGSQGATGPAGIQGATGVTGTTGGAGPQGATGITGTSGVQGATGLQGATGPVAPLLQNYLSGLQLSYVTTTTFQVSAGAAADSTNSAMMVQLTALTKSTSAWAVGSTSGGLDTGAIAASSWYHVWSIRRSDTGIVDVLFSLSATAPTMPASYDQKRRIGSIKTNASSQFLIWIQNGDQFLLDVGIRELDGGVVDTVAHTLTCAGIPTGIVVRALLAGSCVAGAGADARAYISSLGIADNAVTEAAAYAANVGGVFASGVEVVFSIDVFTNTSAQVRYRQVSANMILTIASRGWIDQRGRDG